MLIDKKMPTIYILFHVKI